MQPEVINHSGPDPALIDKLAVEHPEWGVDEWEKWWCKWGRNRWPHWAQMKVCDACNCERRLNSGN